MLDHTIAPVQVDHFITTMAERMTDLARRLTNWISADQLTFGDLEQQVMRTAKELGATLLAGLAQLLVPAVPPPTALCSCGRSVPYQRMRPATLKTILGPRRLTRPYYHCAICHQGVLPFDQQVDICAGGISAGLDELLALLGATQDAFAVAATVLERLTLVTICPNRVRAATEHLGAVLRNAEQTVQTAALATCIPPPVRQPLAVTTGPGASSPSGNCPPLPVHQPPPARMYVSMDGVLVHLHAEGWKEVKLGTIYTTTQACVRRRPEQVVVRAVDQSFVVDLADAASFGPHLWAEAAQRGVLAAQEMVVIGDGAHWIWSLADDYFPGATQIVDWYHASEYIWKAAHTLHGDGSERAKQWARQHVDQLGAGKVTGIIGTLEAQVTAGMAVQEALTYFRNHQHRMDYAAYRARGLQVGSGTMESGCKHVLGARLKQAGLIWNRDGAQAVATVRTWLKSGRWAEALRLRPARRRTYQRCTGAREVSTKGMLAGAAADRQPAIVRAAASHDPPAGGVAAAILQVRAELAQRRAAPPWKRAFSLRQRARAQDRPPTTTPKTLTA